MKLETLKQFGLHDNDIHVYRALLDLGRSTTGPVIDETGIANSRVYASLKQLLKKGLVSYQVRNNVRHYQAELPTQLVEDIEKSKLELQKLAKELSKNKSKKSERNETTVYEGKRGFKQAYIKHIEQCDKGEEISFVGFSSWSTVRSGELRQFFMKLDETQVKKKMKARFLVDKRIKRLIEEDKSRVPGYQFRFLPPTYFNPASINVSKREVLLSVWGKSQMAISIKNPVIIESFRQNFEYLWQQAKK